jgi:hypothetical protein
MPAGAGFLGVAKSKPTPVPCLPVPATRCGFINPWQSLDIEQGLEIMWREMSGVLPFQKNFNGHKRDCSLAENKDSDCKIIIKLGAYRTPARWCRLGSVYWGSVLEVNQQTTTTPFLFFFFWHPRLEAHIKECYCSLYRDGQGSCQWRVLWELEQNN